MADRRLRIFQSVAKHGSFTRAAESLFMSQPAVTFQIRQLEERYQLRLFERGHGAISLTAAGRMMLGFVDRILCLSDEMETRLTELTEELRGNLVVGAGTVTAETLMPGVLADFNALYPQVRLRLVVTNSDSIASQVLAHDLDLGFVDGALSEPDNFEREDCGAHRLLVVCAPDHPLAGESSLSATQLSDYECLMRAPGSGVRRTVESFFQQAGLPPEKLKVQMELGSGESLKSVLLTGLCYAIMPSRCVERERACGQIACIPLCPVLSCRISLLLPKDRFRTRLVNTFVEFSKQKLEGISL